MPTRIDAERTAKFLQEAQIASSICGTLTEVCQEFRAGAGAILLSDETLLSDAVGQLAEALRAQPAWSAVPVLVVARERAIRHLQRTSVDALQSLTIIERPVRTHTLVGLVASALRTRRHQYQIRDAMLELDRRAAQLVARDEKLHFALTAGGLGSWELDLASGELECSAQSKSHFGRGANEAFSYRDLQDAIHPDDKTRVLAAIAESLQRGSDYDVEYRARKPNGDVRWLMVRGRLAYDERGRPLRLAGVSLDITERKRLLEALQASESELADQAAQLRNNDRLKDDFLATLAHELRNPLAPIRTGLDLLSARPDSVLATHTLDVMHRQLEHMVRLIDDLLDVSRITQGKLELKREPVLLSTAVDAALEASRPAIERGRHTLELSCTDEALWLHADLTRVAQVLSNLLNNASKYTASGGTIQLSTRRDGNCALVEVTDNGIGIPGDRLDDVFLMFSQVSRAVDSTERGLGIGLALVRRLVEMHGGTVSASSKGPGRGSTFTVRFPLAAGAGETTGPARPSARTPNPARILIVDDNNDAADLLSLMLEHAGHVTTVAHDGPSALELAPVCDPQIVFLDIGLPGMSGYEVARQLRLDPRFSHTTLVALTGWGTHEDKRRAVAAGFDLHLTKPIDARALQTALDRMGAGNISPNP
ncbi:MAG TPA: ATP-binding protein [Polyangiales bacterium]|nr:ATP-binding protein [Polyangiales bacterium]